jgi:hypothetical protein
MRSTRGASKGQVGKVLPRAVLEWRLYCDWIPIVFDGTAEVQWKEKVQAH